MAHTYHTQVRLSHDAGTRIQTELHLTNLLVHVLHELDHKVDQLVLQHRLSMRVRDKERNIVARYRLAAQHHKALRTLHQKPRELVAQNLLNLISLLDLDAHAHTVDRRLNQHILVLVATHRQRHEHRLRRVLRLDLRDIVPLNDLRAEILQRERRSER